MTSLYPYQRQDADWLKTRQRALNASDMGTGKTVTAITAIDELGLKRVLVICPGIAKLVWKDEWAKWLPRHTKWRMQVIYDAQDLDDPSIQTGLPANTVLIVNYDKFSQDGDYARKRLRAVKWDVVILDESHYLKDTGAKRTKEVFKLINDVNPPFAWAMTGTPIVNHYGDLYPLVRRFWPEELKAYFKSDRDISRERWELRFVIKSSARIGSRIVELVTGNQNAADLRTLLKDKFIRRRKKDVLKDLPPISFFKLPMENVALHGNIFTDTSNMTAGEVAKTLNEQPTHLATQRRELALAKIGQCLTWIQDFFDARPDGKLIVFAHHREVIERLEALLMTYMPVAIMGGTPDKEVERCVREFQEGPAQVFIGQIQKCSTAVTLTASSTILFVDTDWTPGNNFQAAARAHRIGQTEPVTAYHACFTGTLDEAIIRSVIRKQEAISQIFT